VIDNEQRWQIFRISRELSAEDWNLLLEKYQSGKAQIEPPVRRSCFT
jgi:hypothetical protein